MKSAEVYNAVRNIPEVTETQAYELTEMIMSSDKSATKEDLNRAVAAINEKMATKEDLDRVVAEINEKMATKEDLNRVVARLDDLTLVVNKLQVQMWRHTIMTIVAVVTIIEGLRMLTVA